MTISTNSGLTYLNTGVVDIGKYLLGEAEYEKYGGSVEFYSLLPDVGASNGSIYHVRSRTPNYWTLGMTSRYLSGWYESDGVNWLFKPNLVSPVFNYDGSDNAETTNYRQYTPFDVNNMAFVNLLDLVAIQFAGDLFLKSNHTYYMTEDTFQDVQIVLDNVHNVTIMGVNRVMYTNSQFRPTMHIQNHCTGIKIIGIEFETAGTSCVVVGKNETDANQVEFLNCNLESSSQNGTGRAIYNIGELWLLFTNCEFKGYDTYCVYLRGAGRCRVTFMGCVFKLEDASGSQYGIVRVDKISNDLRSWYVLNFTSCIFYDDNDSSPIGTAIFFNGKADEFPANHNGGGITINGCTFIDISGEVVECANSSVWKGFNFMGLRWISSAGNVYGIAYQNNAEIKASTTQPLSIYGIYSGAV